MSSSINIPKDYQHQEVENKWYQYWLSHQLFRSVPDQREPYTIVIPPPNVTGVLHMGHLLNNTIQDVLIRRARMQGYNACWVPGTDHASIATEAKVVNMLKEQGINKHELSRSEFLEHAFQWKEQYGGIILKQLRKLGASCDWERTRFTMEPKLTDAVIQAFVKLYNKGKIYRGERISHWDPKAKTALSDQEVHYQEKNSKLYYIKYPIVGTQEHVTIATTRPETMLGDTALCFNPHDDRFTHLRNKKASIPLINREIPIITDEYVDMDFGTGGLKVTPAHDPNDFLLGQKHKLEIINIFNDDATLNQNAQRYIGEDRFTARRLIVADLDEAGYLLKIEDIQNKIGYSERSNAVVEPRLTKQWYVSMQELADPALKTVLDNNIRFLPEKYKNVYRHWLENIRDWCISRQLWWGQRIPVYYLKSDENQFFVAETAEKALALAQEKTGNTQLTQNDLKQDEDVLDTWFSSWLWPISVFDGFEQPEGEIQYYYPTNTLVTGWDIIFLWVARMIMAGLEFKNEIPFKDVYFTGMVRDPQRRKMSKSLGNSPDALKLIDQYGADAVRLGLLMSSPAGGDLLFDQKLCEQGRNFNIKLWNALRLIKGWEVTETTSTKNQPAIDWMEAKLNRIIAQTEKEYKNYRLSEILKSFYSFAWNDFCSTFLEWIKPDYEQPIDAYTYEKTIKIYEGILQLLHPYLPFLTEEIWQQLRPRANGESIAVSTYPQASTINQQAITQGETAKDIITNIRDIRNKFQMKQRAPLSLIAKVSDSAHYQKYKPVITQRAFLEDFTFTDTEIDGAVSFLVGQDTFYVPMEQQIDAEAEKDRLLKELEYQIGFQKKVQAKLSNQRFVNNAPEIVVNKEKEKLADAEARIQNLKEELQRL